MRRVAMRLGLSALALLVGLYHRPTGAAGPKLPERLEEAIFEQPLGPAADDLKRRLIERFGRPFFADDPVLQKEMIGGHEVFWWEDKQNSDMVKTYNRE